MRNKDIIISNIEEAKTELEEILSNLANELQYTDDVLAGFHIKPSGYC